MSTREASPPLPRRDLDAILESTRGLWEEVRGRRLFMTGGTGFFGSWLTESFLHVNRELALGAHLTVLTRAPERFACEAPHLVEDRALTLLAGDVRSFAFPSGRFEFIVHAATEASAKQLAEEPEEMLSTMLAGTARVLEFAKACGAKKLLLTSSGAVYGTQPRELARVAEDFRQAPDPLLRGSVYGEGKRVSEMLCGLAASDELAIKIARCFAFVGPHLPLDTHFAAGNFVADALAQRPIHIASDGTAVRSYLYAADLAGWLWHILFRGQTRRAYNVGSEQAVSILELAECAAHLCHPAVRVLRAAVPKAGAVPARYVPSTERARLELGLAESVSLPEALSRALAWEKLKLLKPAT